MDRLSRRFAVANAAVTSLEDIVVRATASPVERDAAILDAGQTQHALDMADDRNLTVHTYNEPLALALVTRLPGHAVLLRQWLRSLSSIDET